jgi:hypothetical protein
MLTWALIFLLIFSNTAVLLIRTYAFFSRNIYVLWFLLTALSGVVAYQLYVDTTQMLRKCLLSQSRGRAIHYLQSFHSFDHLSCVQVDLSCAVLSDTLIRTKVLVFLCPSRIQRIYLVSTESFLCSQCLTLL